MMVTRLVYEVAAGLETIARQREGWILAAVLRQFDLYGRYARDSRCSCDR